MQEISSKQLIERASFLLSSGAVSCVLGWSKGELGYDVTPCIFYNYHPLKHHQQGLLLYYYSFESVHYLYTFLGIFPHYTLE